MAVLNSNIKLIVFFCISDEMEDGLADEDADERLEAKRIKQKGKVSGW